MISGLDLNATIDYICKDDKENPTVWKLGVIPSYLFAQCTKDIDNNEIETCFKLLQCTLKGWDNFTSPYLREKQKIFGRDIDVVPISLIESIPLRVIGELYKESIKINQISGEERKN